MRMLKMISGLVWPLRVLSRLLGHLLAVIRPRMAVTRACYVLLGIVLLLGALCSEDHATALAVVGVILLFLRRAPGTRRARIKNVAKQPSATRTRTRVRVSYVLLGIILLLGALGAEQDGQRGYAIALSMAGATLLLLRRRSVQDARCLPASRWLSLRCLSASQRPLPRLIRSYHKAAARHKCRPTC